MRPTFDNAALIDWITAQDPEQYYDYVSCRECLLAQYLRCRGFPHAFVDSERAHLRRYGLDARDLPPGWNDIVHAEPWTFGARPRPRKAGAEMPLTKDEEQLWRAEQYQRLAALNYEKALESDRNADRLIYQRMGATYSRFSRRLMGIEQ